MAQEILLMDDVEGLGTVGDRVQVANGYARNYLIPRKLAAPINKANLRWLEERKRQLQKEYEERLAAAKAKSEEISNTSLTIKAEATDEDKLYGSVSARDIADQLQERGINVDAKAVMLKEPIRELGVYDVDIHLHPEVQANVNVWVVRS